MSVILRTPTDDLFLTTCQALVVPTNGIGANGAGLAKRAKQLWPAWSRGYRAWCDKFGPGPGSVYVDEFVDPREDRRLWIVAVATKDHWRDPSRLEWIETGLATLEEQVAEDQFRSIAIPALGCGAKTGQLDWNDVRPMLMAAAERMSARGLRVEVYPPHEEPAALPRGRRR